MNGCLGVKCFHCHNWQFLKYFFISFTWLHLVFAVACRISDLLGVVLTDSRRVQHWGSLTSVVALGRLRGRRWPRPSTRTHLKGKEKPHHLLFRTLQPQQRYRPCTFIIKTGLYILWFWFWEIKDEDSFTLWMSCCLVTKSCPTLCDPLDCM